MIGNFKHKGLQLFFERGVTSGILNSHSKRIRQILTILNDIDSLEHLKIAPGFKFHKLNGALKEYYSVSVSGNWRIIFKIDGDDVIDVDYLDYH